MHIHLIVSNHSQLAREIAKKCAGMRVRQVSRLLTRVYDECLRPLGVQESQLSLLVAVAIFGDRGAQMGTLAEQLLLDRTTLTRNVVPLEKAGLVRVARSADDARARVVFLTRDGQRMIESAHPLWEEAQAKVRRVLGAQRFEELRSQLSGVVAMAGQLGVGREGQ